MKTLFQVVVLSFVSGIFCQVGMYTAEKIYDMIDVTKTEDGKIIKISTK